GRTQKRVISRLRLLLGERLAAPLVCNAAVERRKDGLPERKIEGQDGDQEQRSGQAQHRQLLGRERHERGQRAEHHDRLEQSEQEAWAAQTPAVVERVAASGRLCANGFHGLTAVEQGRNWPAQADDPLGVRQSRTLRSRKAPTGQLLPAQARNHTSLRERSSCGAGMISLPTSRPCATAAQPVATPASTWSSTP